MPMQPELNPWGFLQESLRDLKIELRSLGEKYSSEIQNIWIKLTEIETRLNQEISRSEGMKNDFKWLIPVIISMIAIGMSIFKYIK